MRLYPHSHAQGSSARELESPLLAIRLRLRQRRVGPAELFRRRLDRYLAAAMAGRRLASAKAAAPQRRNFDVEVCVDVRRRCADMPAPAHTAQCLVLLASRHALPCVRAHTAQRACFTAGARSQCRVQAVRRLASLFWQPAELLTLMRRLHAPAVAARVERAHRTRACSCLRTTLGCGSSSASWMRAARWRRCCVALDTTPTDRQRRHGSARSACCRCALVCVVVPPARQFVPY
jgi:hypothetical protein